MPTLLEVSLTQAKSHGPLYGSLHLLDTRESPHTYFGQVSAFSGDRFRTFNVILWLTDSQKASPNTRNVAKLAKFLAPIFQNDQKG